MTTLDRKMWRDLVGIKGQALAIALVISSGVATYVLFANTLKALYGTRDAYYRESAFADLFVSLKRAPAGLAARFLEIPGISRVETRVAGRGRLAIAGFDEPVSAAIVSIPDAGEPALGRLHLRRGRLPDPERRDECVLGEAAAEAHGLGPGDSVDAVIQGKRLTLLVAGIGISPEHVYQLDPGSLFPDFKRFAVVWMRRSALETAFDLKGAFNDAALSLAPGASAGDAISRLDAMLAPYGGLGAYARADQTSHRYLSEEFRQLGTITAVLPPIFLSVSAFLLSIVVGRLVSTQREQIAILKAFGYGNAAVALHFLKLVSVIVLAGAGGGLLAGLWLGKRMSLLYMDFYRFPFLVYAMDAGVAARAVLVSCGAAVLGTLHAVGKAAGLAPAEGMRPEAPAVYRKSVVERTRLGGLLAQPTRMIVRHVARRPVNAVLAITGIALGCAIMMAGRFSKDSIDHMVEVQLGLSQREDLTVTLVEPSPGRAVHEIAALPGVLRAEPFRMVPVRLRVGNRSRRTAIQGILEGGDLQRLLDDRLAPVALPRGGIALEEHLANLLGAGEG
ncbi:MAG: ABC transporter permease, partial [Gemmatimonadota bacterium]